ncbi:hypothetical protein H5410_046367 [Solanum commersonii]|uniref:Putative plant transposon protein domain-containing protein n=1 Tax=Solanum commersonii TaxID=4109 RepID=A0A9J5XE49_SOLCO|nr:hypothetical protein H5410_046367 [Solanum commersonii]
MVNEKQKMARLITEERRVLTGSLHTVPDIHRLFNLHKCDWMARDPGTYSEEIVREFYASYAATLWGSISKRSKPLAQDPLTSTLVRGCPVDISPATIRRFLYGPTAGHSWSLNTAEFDYRWDIVRSGAFQRNFEQREAVIHWLAKYIAADAKVSPTKADNQVTWDRAVMAAVLVAGVEIDFARMLLAEIHERAFRTSTTYPFPCLIFQLCRDSGVPIWHSDRLVHPIGALDIVSIGPNSSRSTPQLGVVVVPLARVQKLEAQMATLLHYIQPWMQKSIAESEARVERRMEDMMDQKWNRRGGTCTYTGQRQAAPLSPHRGGESPQETT